MDVSEIIKAAKNNSRIKWSIPARNDRIAFEFDGTPIMSAGTVRFHCHQGADIDLVQKNKRKRKKDEIQVLTTYFCASSPIVLRKVTVFLLTYGHMN